MSEPSQTILLDIYERLGSIETTLKAEAAARLKMEHDITKLNTLRDKFGGVILTLSVFWALICAGFVYFSDVIKAKLPH